MLRIVISSILVIALCTGVVAAEERFDTRVTDANLTVTLQGIAMRAGKELALNGRFENNPPITLDLTNRTVHETLAIVSKIANFNYSISDNLIMISPADIGTQNRSYKLKYVDMKEAKKALALFMPEAKIAINELDHTVSVDGTAAQHEKVKSILESLDVPQKQISIKAKIIEISRTEALKLGFNISMPTYDSASSGSTAGSGSGSLGSKIQWAVTSEAEKAFANGKTLAQPHITTINGREAKLLVGQIIPVFSTIVSTDGTRSTTIQEKEVGINVETTPRINEDNTITVPIKTSIKAIAQWVSNGLNKAPQISTREAKTVARVQSGQTIVIGGLLQDSEIKNLSEVPGISKIPILGELFKSRSNSREQIETFIFITPVIVDDLKAVKKEEGETVK